MNIGFTLLKVVIGVLFITSVFIVAARAASPISTQEQLDIVLIEEAAKLRLKGHNLDAELSGDIGITSVKDYGTRYHITLRQSFIPGNRVSLRHELYHVYDKHGDDIRTEDDPINRVLIIIVNEFKAEAYAMTGLRL